MGIGLQVSDDESDSGDEENDEENNTKYSEQDLEELRKEVDASIQNNSRTTIPEITAKTVKLTIKEKENIKDSNKENVKEDEDVPTLVKPEQEGNEENAEELDKNSQKYRLAMIEKTLSDVRSMRTYTSASTIDPEVIKRRVKENLKIKQKKLERKRLVVKGEASAANRQKRENIETIRESHGLFGWAE